jgi:hypothetical protein
MLETILLLIFNTISLVAAYRHALAKGLRDGYQRAVDEYAKIAEPIPEFQLTEGRKLPTDRRKQPRAAPPRLDSEFESTLADPIRRNKTTLQRKTDT